MHAPGRLVCMSQRDVSTTALTHRAGLSISMHDPSPDQIPPACVKGLRRPRSHGQRFLDAGTCGAAKCDRRAQTVPCSQYVRRGAACKMSSWLRGLLAGSQPLQGGHRAAALFRPRPEARAAEERVRRRVAQDLLALSRMLTQLASGPPDGSGPQGRDSKLTAVRHACMHMGLFDRCLHHPLPQACQCCAKPT